MGWGSHVSPAPSRAACVRRSGGHCPATCVLGFTWEAVGPQSTGSRLSRKSLGVATDLGKPWEKLLYLFICCFPFQSLALPSLFNSRVRPPWPPPPPPRGHGHSRLCPFPRLSLSCSHPFHPYPCFLGEWSRGVYGGGPLSRCLAGAALSTRLPGHIGMTQDSLLHALP